MNKVMPFGAKDSNGLEKLSANETIERAFEDLGSDCADSHSKLINLDKLPELVRLLGHDFSEEELAAAGKACAAKEDTGSIYLDVFTLWWNSQFEVVENCVSNSECTCEPRLEELQARAAEPVVGLEGRRQHYQ